MREVLKRLTLALLLALLMHPGLEAAPRKSTNSAKSDAPVEGRDDGAQEKVHPLQYLGPNVEYEVHIHDYPHKPPTPQLYKNTMMEVLKYLEKTFHFVQVVNKDDALATDFLDESWQEWLSYMHQIMPILSKYSVDANNIEHPSQDEPYSIWKTIYEFFLKKTAVTSQDQTDIDGDGIYENDLKVQYSKVKFDPLGKLAQEALKSIRRYTGFDWVSEWLETVKREFQEYLANPQEALVTEVAEDKEDFGGGGGGVVAFPLPAGVLSISKYDPVSLGANAILFIIFHAIFWGSYLPYSGVENLFNDYAYYDDYEDDYEENPEGEVPPEDAAPAEEGGEEAPAEEGEGGGEGEDAGRIDTYSHYNHYYDSSYSYYNKLKRRSGHAVPNPYGGDRLDYGMVSRYGV